LRLADSAALDSFGKLMAAHVRFEERELFATLETFLPQPEINSLETR